jgi:hypothetical protein
MALNCLETELLQALKQSIKAANKAIIEILFIVVFVWGFKNKEKKRELDQKTPQVGNLL